MAASWMAAEQDAYKMRLEGETMLKRLRTTRNTKASSLTAANRLVSSTLYPHTYAHIHTPTHGFFDNLNDRVGMSLYLTGLVDPSSSRSERGLRVLFV